MMVMNLDYAVLSASRIYQSRRQCKYTSPITPTQPVNALSPATTDQSSIQDLIDQLREVRAAKTEQEISFQRETANLKSEIERLRAEAGAASGTRQRLERLEIELDITRTKHANEVAARQGLEKRVKDAERAERETLHSDASKVVALENEKTELVVSLDHLQAQNRRLEEELEIMRRDKDELSQAVREKDDILKEQTATAERSLRDYIAETDGDRGACSELVG